LQQQLLARSFQVLFAENTQVMIEHSTMASTSCDSPQMMLGEMDDELEFACSQPPTKECSSSEEASTDSDDNEHEADNFAIFDNQVSGHMPLISSGRGKIGKPAMPQEVK
jgi:hypothetical protein